MITHLYLASCHGCATIETPLPADIRIDRVNSMTQHYKGKRQSQARQFGDSHTLMCAMMPDGQVRTIESSRPDSELSAWIRQARQDGSVSIYCESLAHVGVDVSEVSK